MHVHTCRCGAVLTCAVEDCAVFEPYQCPTCDAIERDEHFQAVERELTHSTHHATTHGDSRHENQRRIS